MPLPDLRKRGLGDQILLLVLDRKRLCEAVEAIHGLLVGLHVGAVGRQVGQHGLRPPLAGLRGAHLPLQPGKVIYTVYV